MDVIGRCLLSIAKKNAFSANSKAYTVNRDYYTIGLGTDYHYLSTNWVQLYSGASLAYTLVHENYTNTRSNLKTTIKTPLISM